MTGPELPPNLEPIKLQDMLPKFEYAFQTRVLTGYVHRIPYAGGHRLMVSCEGGASKIGVVRM